MKIRLANVDIKHRDLIVQSSAGQTIAIAPLSFGGKISRDYTEIEIGDNELIILSPRGAKDPDGVPLKFPV